MAPGVLGDGDARAEDAGRRPEAREVRRLQAKLGEVMMRLELAEDLLEKRGYGDEVRRHGR